MRFAKYHALGNDYLVVDETEDRAPLDAAAVRRICDRHRGVGSDGILVRLPSVGQTHRLRIWNPDGSQAEKSGNGLRIFARYLWDRGLVDERPFDVSTDGGEVTCAVGVGGRSVTVDMGGVTFGALLETLVVGGRALELSAASIGNPHCVILRERISSEEARTLGPLIESDPRFPNRTNVQFLQVLDRANLAIEIWERGAGYTLASGSSGCAAAAVARRLGLCDAAVTVHMPGGGLAIEIDDTFAVRMTGPVTRVADGEIHAEVFEERTAG